MEIKVRNDDFFDNSKTIEIYNSYEPYYLYEMKRFYKNNNIECIVALDTDLDVYLKHFSNVKFIYLNSSAVHLEEVNKLSNLNGIALCNNQLKEIDDKILEKIEYLEIDYLEKKHIDFNQFKSLKHLRLKNYPFEEFKIDIELISLSIDTAPKIKKLNCINTKSLIKLKLENITKLETIDLECTKLELFDIYDSKKITNLEEFLKSCKNLTEITITSYSDLNAVLNSIGFINNLEQLKYFRTNFKIIDGDLKPLLKIKDAHICRFYKNYNLKDKDLPHLKVFIKEGNKISYVELDSLELGKDDSRISWLD
jgi:hypothetical protein